MTGVEVHMRTTVNQTESRQKVEEAVRNVLGDMVLKGSEVGGVIVLEGKYENLESLGHFRGLLRKMRIRDAARALFTRSAQGSQLSFGLNKQAAYAKRVSFYSSNESPLGPIQVKIKGDVEAAIAYICDTGVK
jgi:predicted RNA binding protein with dsRBD fold (UPF0201 family)